ncbi:MAG: hypothetical protein AB1813_05825 [Verrucomicrobiota bacterium]
MDQATSKPILTASDSEHTSKTPRYVYEHASFRTATSLKEAHQKQANKFLRELWCLLAFVVFLTVMLHLASAEPIANELNIPQPIRSLLSRLRIDPTNAVTLDRAGRVVSLINEDLRWYVGKDQAALIAAALIDRTRRIDDLEDRIVRQALLEFKVKFSAGFGLPLAARDQLNRLGDHAQSNDFRAASSLLTEIVQGWSDETRKKVGEQAIFELNYGLEELARLQKAQVASLGVNLQPPRMHQIFWSSPVGALLEAIVWSIIGTLVNLILNVSQAHSRGKFRPDEIWVSRSKLIYGPVLSFVLILAIYFGILNAGTEMRFWLLPLLGFVFGYNTRKLAMLIDRLSEKLLGEASKSARQQSEWETRAAQHAAAAVMNEARPQSLAEMKEQARRVVESAIVAATIRHQNEV